MGSRIENSRGQRKLSGSEPPVENQVHAKGISLVITIVYNENPYCLSPVYRSSLRISRKVPLRHGLRIFSRVSFLLVTFIWTSKEKSQIK